MVVALAVKGVPAVCSRGAPDTPGTVGSTAFVLDWYGSIRQSAVGYRGV